MPTQQKLHKNITDKTILSLHPVNLQFKQVSQKDEVSNWRSRGTQLGQELQSHASWFIFWHWIEFTTRHKTKKCF